MIPWLCILVFNVSKGVVIADIIEVIINPGTRFTVKFFQVNTELFDKLALYSPSVV